MVQDPQWRSRTAEGYKHMAQACGTLGAGSSRDALKKAAQHFWQALFDIETWPGTLRSDATAIVSRLFRHGPIDKTVTAMTQEDVAETARLMHDLCREFLDWDKNHPVQD